MPQNPPVTMRDIARKLGLSKSTVCDALGDTGTLSKSTREKVKATALAMGYKVNVFASSLSLRRVNRHKESESIPVAILHEGDIQSGDVSNPESIKHAESLGFECQLFNIKEYKNARSLGRMLHARGYVGIVLSRIMSKVDMHNFPWEFFSVVSSRRLVNDWPCDIICEAEETNMRHALQLTKDRGYKRPGVCLMRHPQEAIDDLVRVGVALGHGYMNKTQHCIPPFFETLPENKDYFGHAMRVQQWYKEHRPDVVIGFGVSTYYDLKNQNNLQIPGDTSFIALRLFPEDKWAKGLSGYAYSHSQVLSATFDRLSFLIRHNRKGLPPYRSQIIIEQPWVEGTTFPTKLNQ